MKIGVWNNDTFEQQKHKANLFEVSLERTMSGKVSRKKMCFVHVSGIS